MLSHMKQQPLAAGRDETPKFMILVGKVNAQSKAGQHGSVCNAKLTTISGFNLTVGYSRFTGPKLSATTHAWAVIGDHCTFQWQRELGVIFC